MSGNPSQATDEPSVLLNSLADDCLTADEERRLVALLRSDSAFRREYVRFCELSTQLMWESSTLHEVPSPPATSTRSKFAAPTGRAPAAPRRRSFPFRVASLGIVITAVTLALVWIGPLRSGAVSPGSVTRVTGQLEVIRADRPPTLLRPEDVAHEPWLLQSDDRVQTDPNGSATLTLSDQTEIQIRSGTEVVLAGKPDASVIVSRGSVAARVAPQPAGRPMTFATPRAAVRVLGTELELLVLDERTEVAVTEGRVRVTRTTDQSSAEVAAAQYLAVQQSGPLAVVDWPRPLDVWSEDFAEGMPAGWTGRHIRHGLPRGSRGGLQSVVVTDSRGRSMVASTPIAVEGLFAWRLDSVLQVTFRVQPPAWFHVYLWARTYERGEPLIAWCRVDPDLWQTRPGEWRTVRIPLSAFHLAGFEQRGAALGRIPMRLAFVGPSDLPGIVIDEIRVDRSGSPADVKSGQSPLGDQP